jgi:predicted metallopeptidase
LCPGRWSANGLAVAVRTNMTLAVKQLIRDVARRLPELAHVSASRVLVLAGEARGTSRASIRPGNVGPARGGTRRRFIRVRGRRVLYVMTLRPLWFAASTPEERVATVVHELYHVSTRFDGTLHRGRRHERLPRASYDREVRALLDRYLAHAPDEILAPFAREGEVKVRMWLRLPRAAEAGRRGALDVDEHLFHGFMPLRAKAPPRARKSQRAPAKAGETGTPGRDDPAPATGGKR